MMCLDRELSDSSESTEYSTTSHNVKALLLKAQICIEKSPPLVSLKKNPKFKDQCSQSLANAQRPAHDGEKPVRCDMKQACENNNNFVCFPYRLLKNKFKKTQLEPLRYFF